MRLLIVLLLLLALPAFAADPLYVLVTPDEGGGGGGGSGGGRRVQCRVGPESEPPVVKNDAITLKVRVPGARGTIEWRLPLFAGQNGDTGLAISRVGEGKPDGDFTFTMQLNVADIEKAGEAEKLTLQVRTRSGAEGACSMPAAPLIRAARAVPPHDLTALGAASR